MKTIRTKCFETNSSSTHSVSIRMRKQEEVINNIPRNSKKPFQITEYLVSDGEETETVINTLMSENYKTFFIFAVIVEKLREILDDSDKEEEIIASLCGGVDYNLNGSDDELKQFYQTLLTEKLIYTRWLKEVVYEETGTEIVFKIPNTIDWFPYMLTPYNSETDDHEDEFYSELISTIENNDEIKFKALAHEIIFNKEIIIVDKDEAYCSHIENKIL